MSENNTISVEEAAQLLTSGREYAVLDVREHAVAHENGILLVAINLPLSVLETKVLSLVPRLATPVVVTDGDGAADGAADLAVQRLRAIGYAYVSRLAGGTAAWEASGRQLYAGTQVIGQSFGEFIEVEEKTPHIEATELHRRLAAGEDILVLDSRPLPEFISHSLPDGINSPGAELVRRTFAAVKSPDTLVVINCAGRTRSILGAQALINAGLPNRVVSLKGGTMAWRLAGFDVAHGRDQVLPEPDAAGLAVARRGAHQHADRLGVRRIGLDELARLRTETDRTIYLLDVRSPADYAEGHLPGARPAPNWEAHAWIQRHVGTRNSGIVITDGGDGVLGPVTAAWLSQLNWGEVCLLEGDGPEHRSETGAFAPSRPRAPDVATIDVATLADDLTHDRVQLLDLQPSRKNRITSPETGYIDGHIPGAKFVSRTELAQVLERLPSGPVVLTSPDGYLAHLAAAEVRTSGNVRVLAGGTRAWIASGRSLAVGVGEQLSVPVDHLVNSWELKGEQQLAAFNRYLDWEVALVETLKKDETTPFRGSDQLLESGRPTTNPR